MTNKNPREQHSSSPKSSALRSRKKKKNKNRPRENFAKVSHKSKKAQPKTKSPENSVRRPAPVVGQHHDTEGKKRKISLEAISASTPSNNNVKEACNVNQRRKMKEKTEKSFPKVFHKSVRTYSKTKSLESSAKRFTNKFPYS